MYGVRSGTPATFDLEVVESTVSAWCCPDHGVDGVGVRVCFCFFSSRIVEPECDVCPNTKRMDPLDMVGHSQGSPGARR